MITQQTNPIKTQAGFSLLEVVISILLSVIGILGFYAMQGKVQQSELEAIQREQAMRMVNFIVNQISSNRTAGGCYGLLEQGVTFVGTGYTGPYTCSAYGVIETQNQVNADIAAWDSMLKGTQESLAGENVGGIIGARGCITFDTVTRIFNVEIAWQGLSDITQTSTSTCAASSYGSAKLRRVLSMELQLADLGA